MGCIKLRLEISKDPAYSIYIEIPEDGAHSMNLHSADSFTDNCICICMNAFAICRRPGPVKLTTGLNRGLYKR